MFLERTDLRQFEMEKAVSDINNRSCMMRECKDCPGQQAVIDFIQNLPAMEDKDEIRLLTYSGLVFWNSELHPNRRILKVR